MIEVPVLLDTGPLVALLHEQDSHHVRCRDQAGQMVGHLYTTWAVITEAAWLLRRVQGGTEKLLEMIQDDEIRCIHLGLQAVEFMRERTRQYQDLNPQLADLSLLYLADELQIDTIFTLDRRDFSVYRSRSGKPFQLLPD